MSNLPASFDQLYLDADGPPSAAAVAMLSHGCLVLRRALDSGPLRACHVEALRLFNGPEAIEKTGKIARKTGWCDADIVCRKVFGEGSIALARLLAPRATRHLTAIAGGTVAMHPLCHVRYRHPEEPETALPFHQHPPRAEPGELSLERSRFIGIVIPFTPFDGDCPDVEFVPVALSEILGVSDEPETQYGHFEVDQRDVTARFGATRWRPHLEVGDICLFRECTLHRSCVAAGMTRPRTSVDLRLFRSDEPLTVFRGAEGFALPGLEIVRARSA